MIRRQPDRLGRHVEFSDSFTDDHWSVDIAPDTRLADKFIEKGLSVNYGLFEKKVKALKSVLVRPS